MKLNGKQDQPAKVAIVTGAGKGIGRAIAVKLTSLNYLVFVNDKNPKALKNFRDQTTNSNRLILSVGNASQETYQQELLSLIKQHSSTVDLLINNVGIGSEKDFFNLDRKAFEKTILNNLVGPFFLAQKVARRMVDQKTRGNIIFISSIHRRIPCGNIDYSATKNAITMVVKELSYDLGQYGIRVNAVAPGRITEHSQIDKRIPLHRQTSQPDDIAGVVAWLADNELSAYLTGEIITVDGGLSLVFPR